MPADPTVPHPTAANQPQGCRWCGLIHPWMPPPRCPSIAAMEFHPDGTVRRVEFVQPVPHVVRHPDGSVTVPVEVRRGQ